MTPYLVRNLVCLSTKWFIGATQLFLGRQRLIFRVVALAILTLLSAPWWAPCFL